MHCGWTGRSYSHRSRAPFSQRLDQTISIYIPHVHEGHGATVQERGESVQEGSTLISLLQESRRLIELSGAVRERLRHSGISKVGDAGCDITYVTVRESFQGDIVQQNRLNGDVLVAIEGGSDIGTVGESDGVGSLVGNSQSTDKAEVTYGNLL